MNRQEFTALTVVTLPFKRVLRRCGHQDAAMLKSLADHLPGWVGLWLAFWRVYSMKFMEADRAKRNAVQLPAGCVSTWTDEGVALCPDTGRWSVPAFGKMLDQFSFVCR